jgi:peptidoglycan/LPS O-acetylase OafA/YrhL
VSASEQEARVTQHGSGTATPASAGKTGQGKRRKDRNKANFRPDVEGLRAIAVLLVLLYHAKLTGLSGGFVGVDVFFVISGFLITTQLLNELDRRGTVSLTGFYARRAKRLLPAAAVVLVATMVMTLTLMPRHRWDSAGGDIVSAALYVVNWRFAERSVDYLAEGLAPSPVQHFWSLAVEEQFYLVWPLLMLGAALLARRLHNNRLALGAALAAVAIPSFVWSLTYTSSTPAKAFFVTTTRMWELAVGAGIAVAAALLPRIPRARR